MGFPTISSWSSRTKGTENVLEYAARHTTAISRTCTSGRRRKPVPRIGAGAPFAGPFPLTLRNLPRLSPDGKGHFQVPGRGGVVGVGRDGGPELPDRLVVTALAPVHVPQVEVRVRVT